MAAPPRLYDDLAWVWPFLSPPEDYVEEVAAFDEHFRQRGVPAGGRILHLGSGGGSIDYHLKQRYRVTGVDCSPAMLAHARQLNPEVDYVLGDLRSVRLGRRFDAVLLHDAVAYMTTDEDLRAAYRTAAAHLEPGGVLVSLPEELRERFQQHATEIEQRTLGGLSVTIVMVDYDPDPADTTFETTFVYLIRESGRLRVETDTHLVGIYPLSSFVSAAADAGLTPEVVPRGPRAGAEYQDYPLVVAVAPPRAVGERTATNRKRR